MMSARTKMRFHTLAKREKDRPRARMRSGGGAAACAGRRMWAWQADLPGAGFWGRIVVFIISLQ